MEHKFKIEVFSTDDEDRIWVKCTCGHGFDVPNGILIDDVLALRETHIRAYSESLGETIFEDLQLVITDGKSEERENRIAALHVAVQIYPRNVILNKAQRDSAGAEVFKFADKCVDYIKYGFSDYDKGVE